MCPGGLASYPSSVLMNAVPAKVAGVERIAMVVPTPRGQINAAVLAAAQIAGVTEIYRIGGAQAIAALAYGTATIAPVDKIVGPGNAYVAAAKRQVFGTGRHRHDRRPVRSAGHCRQLGQSRLGRRRPDRPGRARRRRPVDPRHHRSARSPMPSTAEVERQLDAAAARRASPAKAGTSSAPSSPSPRSTRRSSSPTASPPSMSSWRVDDPQALLPRIRHAGAIFLGHHTPEAIGDYVGGSNHVLPTARSARFASGLGVLDFMKRTSILGCDPVLARGAGAGRRDPRRVEGLDGHGRSISIRLNR